jgi:endoglucanase
MTFTNRAWRRLAAAISVALLLSAHLLAAQATTSSRQVVGDFKVFLPLTVRQIAPLRIDAAASAGYTDTSGNLWLADTGFIGGQIGNLGNISIANTSDPRIYQTERFKLTGYALAVANGNYTVRLHFAESFYTAPGQRVFSVTVEGTPINAIDVFAEAGAARTALIKTANVTVSDRQLNLDFTASVGETMIDGIEVIP